MEGKYEDYFFWDLICYLQGTSLKEEAADSSIALITLYHRYIQ
jgi:hypothetical protein